MTEQPLDWERELAAEEDLTSAAVDRILDQHGDRGAKAIDAVDEGRVKEYRDFLVVVGHGDEYVVEGKACTCLDVRYNLDAEDPAELCWHAIAARIATAIGATDRYDLWYSDVREFI